MEPEQRMTLFWSTNSSKKPVPNDPAFLKKNNYSFKYKRGRILLILHPILQLSAIVMAIYVFFLGMQRFRFLHLKQKVTFNWKRHVLLGKITMVSWLAGMFGGISMVYVYWHGFLITGAHGKLALLVMLPLILFGLFSGLYMNRVKKKRQWLTLIHGLNNLIVLGLALYQIYSGWWVYNVYVLGN